MQNLRSLELPRRRSIVVTAVATFVGASYCLYAARQLPASILPGYPGDGFFPSIALGAILLFAAAVVVRELVLVPDLEDNAETAASEDEDAEDSNTGPIPFDLLEVCTIATLSIGYVLALQPVGMEIATSVLMFALFLPRLLMPWPKAMLISAIGAVTTTAFVYFAFVIGLRVSMPLAFLPRVLAQY